MEEVCAVAWSTKSQKQTSWWRCPALAALAVCGCAFVGCGLSDYEEKLTQEQRRMEYVIEENKVLAGPIELPGREGDEKLPDVFFRPPRGISRTPVDDPSFTPLVTYRKDRPDSLFDAVLVYVSTQDRREFWTEALRPFAGLGPSDLVADPNPPQPVAGKAIPYETATGQGVHANCSIYGYHGNGAHVAIVYCLAAGRTDEGPARTEKRYSLASLVVGPEAKKRRQYFTPETQKATATKPVVP
jgi:hypothetical protein